MARGSHYAKRDERLAAAMLLCGAALGAGAMVAERLVYPDRVTITLRSRCGRLDCHVGISRDPSPRLVASWCVPTSSAARIADAFALVGDVNRHHRAKATTLGEPEALAFDVARGFSMAHAGTAFEVGA